MAKTKVLITVKTYPAISKKYEELVCTAGLLEDGSWVRIYPVQFRKKSYNEQYAKYDWIAKTKDLHFFLGTTMMHHYTARNPFLIIGTFHPKPITQHKLF